MNEESIFAEAVTKKSPKERAAYLDGACGRDQAMRTRIEQLLAAHAHPDGFLEAPPPGVDRTAAYVSVTEGPGTHIGPFKLLEKIGEGGMGTVYMADQEKPIQRRVALKIIKPGKESEGAIARFEAERQALAMMDHPNIARVLDAGATVGGRPYFVMDLVKGIPITKYCDDHRLSLDDRLKLFLDVCQAVQHAHQKGVIHRDLKPSNILVAEYDDMAVPKVIDFGLAKALGQRLTEKTMFTGFGEIMGTLEYMSPEQAKFNQLDIDTRSDIYSLGVLLYELVTGSTPFDQSRLREAALDEAVRIIRDEEPQRPSLRLSSITTLASIAAQRRVEPGKLRSLVRGELDWIVMKTLDKERTRRYQTSAALADDVHRYLTDQRVIARPPTAGYLMQKFIRRNRIAICVASALMLMFLAGFVGTSYHWLKAKRINQDLIVKSTELQATNAVLAKNRASLALTNDSLRRQRYVSDMTAAQAAIDRGEMQYAIGLLQRNKPESGQSDLRGIEWDYLRNLTHSASAYQEFTFVAQPVDLAVSSTETYMAVGQANGVISVFEGPNWHRVEPDIQASPLDAWGCDVAFSRQQNQLAYVGKKGKSVIVIDVRTRSQVREIPMEKGVVRSIVFSPTEDVLAIALGLSDGNWGKVIVMNAQDGTPILTLDYETGPSHIAFSPDGNAIAITGAGRNLLWEWKTDNMPIELEGAASLGGGVNFSREGSYLAIGSFDNRVRLWKSRSRNYELIATLSGHASSVSGVDFSENTGLVASASRDTTVRIWDTATLQTRYVLQQENAKRVSKVAFIDGGKTLATIADKSLYLWRIEKLNPWRVLFRPRQVRGMMFSNDNDLYYCELRRDEVRRLRVDTFDDERVVKTKPGIQSFDLSPQGLLATLCLPASDGTAIVEIWDLATRQQVRHYRCDTHIGSVHFSADGQRLVAQGRQGYLSWDMKKGQPVDTIPGSIPPGSSIFNGRNSIANNRVAIEDRDGLISTWELNAGSLLQTFRPGGNRPSRIISLGFSADGESLVASYLSGNIQFWDLKTGANWFRDNLSMQWVATFTHDGKTLLTSGDEGFVTVRDVPTLEARFRFPRLGSAVSDIAISPSGRWMAASAIQGEIRVWDVHSERKSAPKP